MEKNYRAAFVAYYYEGKIYRSMICAWNKIKVLIPVNKKQRYFAVSNQVSSIDKLKKENQFYVFVRGKDGYVIPSENKILSTLGRPYELPLIYKK